jgi:hypothetical protein
MYQTPTANDFQRNLAAILQRVRDQAHGEIGRIRAEYAARGLGQSGPLIGAVAERFNQLHGETVEAAMDLIRQYVSRTRLSPVELSASARPILETLSAELDARIPVLAGDALNRATEQTRARYRPIFARRIDDAIRDIEIGFIGGRDVAGQADQDIQTHAFELLKAIEEETRGSADPIVLHELRQLKMTEGQAQAAFQYLKGRGLIDANFRIHYAARVSAAGRDAIRDSEANPGRAIGAFPAITHNYYLNVQSMTGSNIQQGTTNSTITATQTISDQQLAEGVRLLIAQLDRALQASQLSAPLQDQAKASIAELREATDVPAPDASRLRRGLEALKRIMEQATGDLVAAGVLGLIGDLLHAGAAQ